MNPKLILALKSLISIAPKLKSWVFSDGKFQVSRALVLLGFFLALLGSVELIGVTETTLIIDMLDQVSDIVGYVE